jgi:hypothetical protein
MSAEHKMQKMCLQIPAMNTKLAVVKDKQWLEEN